MYFGWKLYSVFSSPHLQFLWGTDTTHVMLFTSQPSQPGFQQYLTDIRETTYLNLSGCWTIGSHDSSYVLQQMVL